MAEKPKKPSSPTGASKETAPKSSAAKSSATKSSGVKKSSVESSTKKVGGGTKSHPVTQERLQAAEDAIRKKTIADNKGYTGAAESLKHRASEAKKRAQEKILDESYVSDPVDPLERLANTFSESARRWELMVYPTMFAFILLASYGFFLIFHLTHDISVLSKSVTEMASIVSDAMPKMTKDMRNMTGSMDHMTGNIDGMTGNLATMTDQMKALRPMNANLANMTDTMGSMNRSVYGMHRDVGNMNQTVSSGPMGMMNDIMPFSSNSYNRPMPPPVYIPPAITPPPRQMYKPRVLKPKSSLDSTLKSVPADSVDKNRVSQSK